MCDSLSEVQGKGSCGPQQEEPPSVYGQQAASGYIPSCRNKSLLTTAIENSTYFMAFAATEKNLYAGCQWEV